MNRTFFKLFLAVFTAVFFAACSTPTIPNDDDSYGLESSSSKEKSSSSKKLSSSSKAKSSSSKISPSSSSKVTESSSSKAKSSSSKISSSSSSKVTESSSSKAKSSSSKVSSSSSSSEKKLSSSISLLSIYEAVEESGLYTTKDSVAAYLCKFDKLPANYVGKNEGKKLYEFETGKTFSKWNFNPWTTIGVMIGGDNFDNYASDPEYYHETLPEGSYHEADVDYSGKNRGTNRLVYQSDCIIFYTADHYETFKKLEIR